MYTYKLQQLLAKVLGGSFGWLARSQVGESWRCLELYQCYCLYYHYYYHYYY